MNNYTTTKSDDNINDDHSDNDNKDNSNGNYTYVQ